MSIEQAILALVLGTGFGVFAWYVGSTVTRLAMFLFVLWVFQSASQQVWRGFDRGGDFDELLIVAGVRLLFAAAALAALAVLNRSEHRP